MTFKALKMNSLKLRKYKEKFDTLMVFLEQGEYLEDAPIDEVAETFQLYLLEKIKNKSAEVEDLKLCAGMLEWMLDELEDDLLD